MDDHTPTAIVLNRFSGVSDPTVWASQAERYFTFYGFSKNMWLSLPYLYFYGEALTWISWLYHNEHLNDWKHFTDKLAFHYRQQIVTERDLPSLTDLLLQMDANLTHMRHHLDNLQNTLSACSQKFSNSQTRLDLTASLADKCDVVEQETISALNKLSLNNEDRHTMLEHPVTKSKVLPKLLNSTGSFSTSIPFPFSVISIGCVETLDPLLDSKIDLDDLSSYASKVFAKMPDKKIGTEVEHPVIYYSGNPASYMFDEMFQAVSLVQEGEYNDIIMLDNSHLSPPCLLSTGSHAHLIRRSIFDYYREFDYAKLLLWLYRFPSAQFGFSFPFDPDSSLLTIFLDAASYDSHMVVADFKGFIRIFTCRIDSTSNTQCILSQFPFIPTANFIMLMVTASRSALDLCIWNSRIGFRFMALTRYKEYVEELLLFGYNDMFFLIVYSNSMSRVWDPGQLGCVKSNWFKVFSIVDKCNALTRPLIVYSLVFTEYYVV